MKVLSIREVHRQSDDKLYWKCQLEGSGKPLIVWTPPTFSEGDDISADMLTLTGDIWSLKSEVSSGSEKDSSIRAQGAYRAILDLFIAGKLADFQESKDYLVVRTREAYTKAIALDPFMGT